MLPPTESRLAELDARTSRHGGVIEQIGHRLTNLKQGQRGECVTGIQITTLLTLGTLILFKLGN